jgi:hypothetical protein
MVDWSGSEQASAALEEVTAPSVEEKAEATPAEREEVASRQGGWKHHTAMRCEGLRLHPRPVRPRSRRRWLVRVKISLP